MKLGMAQARPELVQAISEDRSLQTKTWRIQGYTTSLRAFMEATRTTSKAGAMLNSEETHLVIPAIDLQFLKMRILEMVLQVQLLIL